ncbi:PadR family transcriptional regulator [soil metagenome]
MDTTQLLKGVLDLAVLAVVDDEDGYGYDVVRRLRAGGLQDVGDASVYGTLRRLYASGALTSYVVPSDEGPHRKYYGITTTGRAHLKQQREDGSAFARTVSDLLDTDRTTTTATAGGAR